MMEQTIHERFRAVRDELDLTMAEYGARLGITAAAVSNIEKGKNKISDRTIKAVCREFGIREEWLRDGTGDSHEPGNEDAALFAWAADVLAEDHPFKIRVLELLRKLDKDQWQTLQEYAEFLAGEDGTKKDRE